MGATGADLKSRSVVLDEYQPGCSPDLLPIAEIDGGDLSEGELYLQPRKIFPDPFRGGQHILVLCDIYIPPLVSPACTALSGPHSNASPDEVVIWVFGLLCRCATQQTPVITCSPIPATTGQLASR